MLLGTGLAAAAAGAGVAGWGFYAGRDELNAAPTANAKAALQSRWGTNVTAGLVTAGVGVALAAAGLAVVILDTTTDGEPATSTRLEVVPMAAGALLRVAY